MGISVTGEYMVPGKFPIKTEEEHFERYKFASKYVYNMDVLDLACGVGYGCKIYAESGAKSIIGIDKIESNIKFAQRNYNDSKISFFQGNIYDINYKESFNIVTSFETIEHLNDDDLAIKKLHSALKHGGILIISTPNRTITSPGAISIYDKPNNEFHYREYTLIEFKSLVKRNGFFIKQIYGQRNRPFLPIGLFNKVVNKVLEPDLKGNAELKKTFFTTARYYTLVLLKKEL